MVMSYLYVVIVCVLVSYYVFDCVFIFFFFKQKTAYEMRISDWSSDVLLFRSHRATTQTWFGELQGACWSASLVGDRQERKARYLVAKISWRFAARDEHALPCRPISVSPRQWIQQKPRGACQRFKR